MRILTSIEIRGFDANNINELAKEQTRIYNLATEDLEDYIPAKTEEVINRFKRKEFDPFRMFYAFDHEKIVGYSGLTGKDKEKNLRSVGYPWLDKGVDPKIRNLLYDRMEKQCKDEGTRIVRSFTSDKYPEINSFFKSKGYHVIQEFLVHHKILEKNTFVIPKGYFFRSLKKEDLPKLVNISKKDSKMKLPLKLSDLERFMASERFNPDSVVVAEKDGVVVGFYALLIPSDPNNKKCYFNGVTMDPEHEQIEDLLLKELENRALHSNKEILELRFYPDSLRLPKAKEKGFDLVYRNFQVEKVLF